MCEKIVLIGAGSAMFTRGIVADLIKTGWKADLALVDIDADALAVAQRLSEKMVAAKKARITISASLNRRDVLRGATVVISTIAVGGRQAWELDVSIPKKYGIWQPVGDSVMPGGTSRAMRMIPAMIEIANDIGEIAPKAFFFNYGNPMTAVCRAIRKATGVPVIGLCHGVYSVAGHIAGKLGVDFSRLAYTASGLNHLTWFTKIFVDGKDAMPQLHELARRSLSNIGYDELGTRCVEAGTATNSDDLDNPACWQLLELFGAYPAVFDAHVMEFFPHFFASGDYFGKLIGRTCYKIEERIAWGGKIFSDMKKDAFSDEPLNETFFKSICGEHEQVLDILASIRHDDGRIYSANIPNQGQVPNLPRDAVLESPARACAGGIMPICQDPLPNGIAGTLAARLQWVETVVEAAIEGSRDKFIQALILDGSVTSFDMAVKLADELLAAHRTFFVGKPYARLS